MSERNFLGRGQYIKVSAGGGKNSRDYSLSFTEPYFLGRRIAAGFDVYRQTRAYNDRYSSDTTGATIRLGLPITDSLTSQIAYNYSREEYELDDKCVDDPTTVVIENPCNIAPQILDAIVQSPWVKSSVSWTLLYNTLDDPKNPRDGLYSTFSVEYAGLGGDAEFVKLTGRGSYYHTLLEEQDVVGLVSIGAGHVVQTGGPLRLFDYFQNDTRMIRGFESSGIGPVATNGTDHLGGETYINASAEAQFPLPAVPESLGIKGAVFADAATLFGNDLAPLGTDMEWRASVGASLLWQSPFGPIRFDYAVPVVKEPTDQVQHFNFGVSTRF